MPKKQRNSTRAGGRKKEGNPAAIETVGSSADVPVATLSLQELLDAVGDKVRQESLKVASSVSAETVDRQANSSASGQGVRQHRESDGGKL